MRWSAHLSTLFQDVPAKARPQAAAAAGFAYVETWWPPDPDPVSWAELVNAAGLRAACVNADGGDLAAGERGYCAVPERRDDVVVAATAAARTVTACGGRLVNLLVGRERDGVETQDALGIAVEAVRAAADAVAPLGAELVIEHLNPVDVSGPLLATPAAADAFVRSVARDNVSVLFDAYHAAAAGLDVVDALAAVTSRVGHVQYADHPGRGAPGSGRVSLEALVAALVARGYDGAIGLEFIPAPDSGNGLDALGDVHPALPFPSPPRDPATPARTA